MKHIWTAKVLAMGLGLAILAGAFAQHAVASDKPEPLPYDLADLILDRTLVGRVITVVEQLSCFDENNCQIRNPPFARVIPVQIGHLPVTDARRLVVGCHFDRCVERMIGLFTGTSLDLMSSTDYMPWCLPATYDTLQIAVDFGAPFATRCYRNNIGADRKDSLDNLVSQLAAAAKTGLEVEDLQFELSRGQ